jgi:hypothetical protein
MNPLARVIRSHIVSNMVLKQYMLGNGYPNEIAGLILAIACELIEWTLVCQSRYVAFMIEDDLFVWGRSDRESLRYVEFFYSPRRIVDNNQRKFILTDMELIKHGYSYKPTVIHNNNIVFSSSYNNEISLCEISVPNVRRIFWGNYTAFVVTQNGDVYSCGRNNFGQLGLNSFKPQYSLIKINFSDESTKIVKIACGFNYTLFLSEMGIIYACGDNNQGQLGIEDTPNHMERPVSIALSHVIDIYCGHNYSIAITSDGDVHAWGGNYTGQLGLGDTINRMTPQLITFPEF